MKSVIPFMTKGSGRRALIYDAKRDTAALLPALLEGIEPPPVTHFMNPFDLRSSPWEMNQDIREGATALQIAGIFIPETGGESQPFFRNAARILLAGVMEAFTRLAPNAWTLRDVILALRFKERIVAILASHPETASLIPKYVSGKSRDDDVATTLDTFLRPFSFVAASWHHSDQPSVSLEQWARSEELLILGSDPKFDSILQPLNRAIFKRAVELVRRQPDVKKEESRQSWFFIDELRNAGALEDIDKLLVEGRSKGACVVIGFQDNRVSGFGWASGSIWRQTRGRNHRSLRQQGLGLEVFSHLAADEQVAKNHVDAGSSGGGAQHDMDPDIFQIE